jgi:hypothetical protein
LSGATSNFLVQLDNQGMIGVFAKGHCPSFEINLSVCRALSILAARNIHLQLRYVKSAKNPADPISCGKMGLLGDLFPVQHFAHVRAHSIFHSL